MKKIMALLAITFLALQGVAFAATAEGTVKSVDATMQKIEIESAAGASWVVYSPTTTWPEGVTDPNTLVGKQVKIATDEATQQATSVEEVMPAPAA